MNLDMYIYTDSFTHNEKDSDYDVIERLNKFTELTTKVGTKFRDDNRKSWTKSGPAQSTV